MARNPTQFPGGLLCLRMEINNGKTLLRENINEKQIT
jgi:hypothetical protein